MFAAIPLLAVVLVLANLVGFGSEAGFGQTLVSAALPSGGQLVLTTGDGLVLLGLVLLYFEIFKATRTGTSSIADHALSLLVFVLALVEFLIMPRFAHASFLAILLMTLIDVIAGFTVTISGARRDFASNRME